MLCKAIVEQVLSIHEARVRIPIYHQIASSPFATLTEDLPIATISTIPGISYALHAGDIVYVDFELDQRENPVIVGVLSRDDSPSSSNIEAQSLKVDVNCDLPENVFADIDSKYANVLDTINDNLIVGVAKFG